MKKNEEKTNVIRILEQNKINFKVYNYINSTAISGTEVADYLGEDYNIVFKTLVTIGKSGNHYVFLVPVNKELDLKKAAVVVEEKSIEMIKSKELLPLTGYIHGGCSPVGMKKNFTTIIDKSAKDQERIIFSGGKIGYQIDTTLEELAKIINEYKELYDFIAIIPVSVRQNKNVEEIAKEIGVDSLGYLSVEATHKLAENTDFDYCDGCFTGKYPIEVPKEQPKDKFEEKLNKFSAYYQVLD